MHALYPKGPVAVYTEVMSRRCIALLLILVTGLQGNFLAFAPELTASTGAAHCCPGHASGIAGDGCSRCPAGVLSGSCGAGSPVFTAMLNTQFSELVSPARYTLSESGSVSFTTEIPSPHFRPPIV